MPTESNPEPSADEEDSSAGLWATVRAHPWITAIMLITTVAGCIAGTQLLTPEWSLARRMAAGAFGGAWVGLTMTAIKMIG